MKKRFTGIFAILAVLFAMTACSNTEAPEASSTTTTIGTTTTINTTTAPVVTPSEMDSVLTTSVPESETDIVDTEVGINTTMVTTTTTALYSDSDSSSSVVTTVPVDTEVTVTGTSINGYVPVVTTTGESGYVPSTSLTQGTTSKVTTTTKTTTTKKPTTTTKKTTTKTTTTTKKTTTTAKTTTKSTTTTKATTTTASYVPFSKPVDFIYDETNDVYRATMNDGSIIAYKDDLYGQLLLLNKPSENYDSFENLGGGYSLPLELTLHGKTKDGKYYYATAMNYGIYECEGYIPVDTSCFIDVYFDYDAAYEIFELINKERVKAGVEPLKYDYNLEKYAMFRSEQLYTYFSHSSPSNEIEVTKNMRYKYVYPSHYWYTENIYQLRCDNAWTKYELPSAAKINQCWVDSSGHYASMICDDWKAVGVGVYRTEKGTFAVQFYGDCDDTFFDEHSIE